MRIGQADTEAVQSTSLDHETQVRSFAPPAPVAANPASQASSFGSAANPSANSAMIDEDGSKSARDFRASPHFFGSRAVKMVDPDGGTREYQFCRDLP